MNLQQKIEDIYGLELVGMRLGLERIKKILSYFQNPHLIYPTIHIAGTNGKGSTAQFLSSILIADGKKVGLYTSPHLFTFNERIKIQNRAISDTELEFLIDEVQHVVQTHNVHLTFFEFTTTLAFVYFAKQNVDIAVIEIGLGGELDATNVIQPKFTILTNIDYDHQEFLGKTLREISQNECSILKQGTILITSEQKKTPLDILTKICLQKSIAVNHSNKLLQHKILQSSFDKQQLFFSGIYKGIVTISPGNFQIQNAKNAIIVAVLLGVKRNSIQKGLELTQIVGRMQCVWKNPLVIIDGAHNALGMFQITEIVKTLPKPRTLVYARSDNTYKKNMGVDIFPHFQNILTTQGVHKELSAEKLCIELQELGFKSTPCTDTMAATQMALAQTPITGSILVVGSLYMIPQALQVFTK